jgi:hypothetical protein
MSKKYERKSDRIVLPPDTIQAGCGLTLFGQRYLVAEMEYTASVDGSVDVGLLLQPLSTLDPVLYYQEPPKPKKRRVRRKAKKK